MDFIDVIPMPKKDYDEIIMKSLDVDKKDVKGFSKFNFQDFVVSILFTLISVYMIIQVYVLHHMENMTLMWIFILLMILSYILVFYNYKRK